MAQIGKQRLYQLKADRAEALKSAESAMGEGRMEDYEAEMEKVKDFNGQIDRVEKLLEERERFRAPNPRRAASPMRSRSPRPRAMTRR